MIKFRVSWICASSGSDMTREFACPSEADPHQYAQALLWREHAFKPHPADDGRLYRLECWDHIEGWYDVSLRGY
jgi:hypothetical protein